MKNNTLRNTVTAAMLAAVIAVMTLIHVPIGSNGGYVHIGDAFIYLAACFLPRPYAMLAGAIGGGISDLISAPVWVLPTVIIKSLIVLPFSPKTQKIITKRNVAAMFAAAVITCLGYYLAEALMFGNWSAPLASVPGSIIQAVGSAIIFTVIGLAFDKIDIKSRLSVNKND